MKLYVGNLSFNTTTQDLETMFGEAGTVQSASIIEDRETGRSRGFAFVEMKSDDADRALTQLKGCRLNGKAVMIDEAHPRGRSRHE